MNNLTIILCCYNEERTVCTVVKACRLFNEKAEIILVDDGSTDQSEALLKKLNETIEFRYIRLPENRGKSYAMVVGIENASNDVLLFFDADSIGTRKDHFTKITKPITENKADMVLGHTAASFGSLRLTPFKAFTGQRALLKKDILPILEEIRHMKFGIETYINLYYQTHGKRIKYVHLEGLRTLTKYEKAKPLTATRQYFSEGYEISSTIIKNSNLLFKIAGSSLNNTQETLKKRLNLFQQRINRQLQMLRDKVNV